MINSYALNLGLCLCFQKPLFHLLVIFNFANKSVYTPYYSSFFLPLVRTALCNILHFYYISYSWSMNRIDYR